MTNRDMTAPNWARTAKRLRRYAEELRREGAIVILPEGFDKAPAKRKHQPTT